MRKALCFVLTFILILNTVITPEMSVRAQNVLEAVDDTGVTAATGTVTTDLADTVTADTAIRTASMSRADKILGLEQYDEYGIGESDTDIYEYQMHLKYPASYLVEAARLRWGYTSVMSVINFANNEDFRWHPEYYYEAALMSLLFEQMNDQSFWDGNEQEVDKETINIAKSLLGTAVGAETDALEELQKLGKNDISDEQYLNALKGLQGLQNAEAVLHKIFDYATDALEVVQYAESMQKILSLQEEIVNFLDKMKEYTNNEHLKTALDKIVAVYQEQQRNPDNAINIVVGLQTGEMAMSRIMQNSLDVLWEGLCVMFPELKVIELAFSIEGFVLEQVFSPDAISDAYAKLAAIWELEEVARDAVYYLGLEYSQNCGSVTEESEKLAGAFNTGWDFFTILLDADCQASLLFAKVTYNSGIHSVLESFSGGDDYKEFASQVKLYQNRLCDWKNAICIYMEGLKPENRKVSGAVFPENEVKLEPGETYTLNLEVIPADAKDNYVEYGIVAENNDSGDTDSYNLVKENNIVRIEGDKLTALSHGTVQIEGIAGDCGINDVLTVHVALGGISEEGLIFRVEDNNEAVITGYVGTASKVEIPSYISNSRTDTTEALYPVTKVEKFTGHSGKNTTVQEIVLPSSVTEIDAYAFYRCTAMKKINLENVPKIGEYAFGYCSSLEKVTLKQSKTEYTKMGGFAFAYCTSLREIDLSGILLANIPEGFCFGCTGLKTILWPPNVQRIRYWAFFDCGFEELSLPQTIGVLEASAIYSCDNLKKLVLPSSIQNVDEDPIKFVNADDTIYYVEKGSYMHRRFEYWNNTMGVDFTIRFTGDESGGNAGSGSDHSGDSSGKVSSDNGSTDASSSEQPSSNQLNIKAKTIKKAKKSENVTTATAGKSLQLKVKVTPANTTQKITWTSSKKKVATVSQNGKVTPKKKGKTTITAKLPNGKKVTWKITVKEVKAKKIRLTKKKATLHVGETLQLKTKLKPKGSTAKIKWKSSRKKIVSVSKNGTVTARKKGKAVITAQLPNGRKATCKITVKKAAPQSNDSVGGNNNSNTGGSNGQNTIGGNSNGGNTTGGGSSTIQPGGDTETPGSDTSDEDVPTKLILATDTLTLKGRWQTITLSEETETEVRVGDELDITAETGSFYGDSQILDAEITEGNDMQRIHWSSADETIVKVYSGGLVRGVRTGTTTVTATTTDGATAQCQITVEDADLQWESSDTEVAEISVADSDGRTAHITASKEGTADITVLSGTYQSTCRLTVSADSTDPDDADDSDNPNAQLISTVEDLKAMANDLDGDYILSGNLNLSGTDWTPIGTADAPFTGTFDGKGYTISGLTINEDTFSETGEQYYGLFGVMKGNSSEDMAEISDLTLEGSIVLSGTIEGNSILESTDGVGETETVETSSDSGHSRMLYVGAFAAKADKFVRFDHCISKVNITANIGVEKLKDRTSLYSGGISGENGNYVSFIACENQKDTDLRLTGGQSATIITGGIMGRGGMYIILQQCQNSGNIKAHAQTATEAAGSQSVSALVGGIAGYLLSSQTALTNCKNSGDINSYANMTSETSLMGDYCLAGGIAARIANANIITGCENTGNVLAESSNAAITVSYGELFGYPAE